MIKKRRGYLNVIAVHNHLRARPFAFYATNDLQLGGAEIWRISRSRWHHEEMFRNLKGLCSFGKLPSPRTVRNRCINRVLIYGPF